MRKRPSRSATPTRQVRIAVSARDSASEEDEDIIVNQPSSRRYRSFATNLSDPRICEDFEHFLETLSPELRERYQVEHYANQEEAVPSNNELFDRKVKPKKTKNKKKQTQVDDGDKKHRHRASSDTYSIPKQYESAFRSKGALYKRLRSLFLVSEIHFIQAGVVRGTLGVYQNRFQHIISYPTIIHPYSNFIWLWNVFSCVCLAVSLIYEPYMIAFRSAELASSHYLGVATFVNVILCLDMILYFRVGYKDKITTKVILDPPKITVHYLKYRFWYNLFTRFPYDTIVLLSMPTAALQVKTELTWIRPIIFVIKLLRYDKLQRFLRDLTLSLNFRAWTTQVLLHGILIFHYCHWGACAQFLFPDIVNAYEIEAGRPYKNCSWLTGLNLWDKPPHIIYLNSYLRTLAIILCLDGGSEVPRETEEILVSILLIIMSITAVAYFISTFSTMPMTEYSTNARYTEIVTSVHQYLRFKKTPNWLCERVKTYYAAKYKGRCFAEDEIFKNIPQFLKNEILLHNCRHILERIYIFKQIPWTIVQNLVQRFKQEVYIAGDVILSPYTHKKRSLYFIDEGVFGVFNDYGGCVKLLERGDTFGEMDLLFPDIPRKMTIICLAISTVYILSRDEYAGCVQNFPEINVRIRELATEQFIDEMYRLEKYVQENVSKLDKNVMSSRALEDYYADMDQGKLPMVHNMLPEHLQKMIERIARRSLDKGLLSEKMFQNKDDHYP